MAEMIGAFMAETIYLNRLSGIGGCVVNGRESVDAALTAWNSMTSGDEM